MAFAIVENIRGFFTSRPPLVVFMICLGAFAIVLITFAYVIKVKDMPNPDVTEVCIIICTIIHYHPTCIIIILLYYF